MKLCHENNGAAIYVGGATTVHNPSFECSTGQLLQHISKSIAVCALSRPKMLTKKYNKEIWQAS